MRENNFKQTEIDLIPEDWEVVRLGEIIIYKKGKKPRKLYDNWQDNFLPYLTAEFFRTGQLDKFVNVRKETGIEIVNSDDVVLIWDGSKAGDTFTGLKGILASTMIKIDVKDEHKVSKKLIYYFLKTKFNILNTETTGSTIPHISKTVFENLVVLLPPLEEQRKIAKVLDTIQQAIELQDRIIEQTKNLKKSLMQKLFTEGLYGEEQKETEIGLIPKSWEVVRLGEVFEVQQGKQLSRKREIKKGEIECKFLRTSNVFWEGIKLKNLDTMFIDRKELDGLKVRKGDIFVCEGGDVGRTAILEEDIDFDLIFQNHLHRLRPKSGDIYSKFFVYWMKKYIKLDKVHVPANVTTIPNLSASRLKLFPIPLPSLEEQKQIAHILSTVDKKIEVEQNRKQILKELFKTMLHKLMSGEIRLKEVEI